MAWTFRTSPIRLPRPARNAEAAVAACGYNSGRGLGRCPEQGCRIRDLSVCGVADSRSNLYYTGAPDQLDETWTLADIQSLVTQAQANGGGWVQLTFHHIGDGIDPTSNVKDPLTVSTDVYNQFADWLAGQVSTNTTNPVLVKTVKEVIGGTTQPLIAGPAAPAPQTTGNL